jgi:hypothetical protein
MSIARLTKTTCRWAFCLAGLTLMFSPSAWSDDCSLATDAAIAQVKVPHGVTHVMAVPGKPEQRVEIIFVNEKTYTSVGGEWHAMPFSSKDMVDTIEASRIRAEQMPHTCQKVAGETINGEPTTVLVVHSDANGKPSDAKIWISNTSGLPLKSEVHLGSGTVASDEFRYGNITAPPGVN